MEKLLLEACLEMMSIPGLVVGIQDMGAAGLTCSTCETASRGDSGIEIDLDLVPQRETGMNSYEIMLSESQERMLVIVAKGTGAGTRGSVREMGPACCPHWRGKRGRPHGSPPQGCGGGGPACKISHRRSSGLRSTNKRACSLGNRSGMENRNHSGTCPKESRGCVTRIA